MPFFASAFLAILFVTLPCSSLAGKDIPESVDVTADLSVAADGKIVKLEFVRKLSPELEQFLRERVQTWTIKPARRNGRAVGGDTTLYLRLSLEPDGDDVLVRVAKASTGPRSATIVPPKYPLQALQWRRQAILIVTVDVRADGTVDAMSSRMLAGNGSENAFIAAAERSIGQWRFVPERVDGLPVATKLQVPIEFRISHLDPLEAPVLESGLTFEPNELIADSEFELASDVVGRKL